MLKRQKGRVHESIYLPLWLDNKIREAANRRGESLNEIINLILSEKFEPEIEEVV